MQLFVGIFLSGFDPLLFPFHDSVRDEFKHGLPKISTGHKIINWVQYNKPIKDVMKQQ